MDAVKENITLLIGGDICPIGRNRAYFASGDAAGIFGDLLNEFEAADLTVVNLECPLIGQESPILKSGPMLGVGSECVRGLKNAHIDVVNLANNHILDHGEQGIKNTIDVVEKSGIAHVGAGRDLNAAREILICQVNGIRVGILSLTEHGFSIATKHSWGANPLDIIDSVRNINSNRGKFDYLIVLLHGGNENYPYPRPSLMDTCRFFAEQGANAVICQHSHISGCYEKYQDSHIVYGQGNLIFDKLPYRDKSWHEGFVVALEIDRSLRSEMEIIPFLQSDPHPGIHRMPHDQEKEFLDNLVNRSMSILEEGFVEKQWEIFCQKHKKQHLFSTCTNGSIFQRFKNKFNLIRYSKKSLLRKFSMISCESHREVLTNILADEIRRISKL
jgi:poly-gamma-glutamate capsule biosynthesis protein CapA/YwtB (metallophosphatase superfamily)